MGKRYYWLKLPASFFESLEIKRLRKLAGGDTFTIIYLKMMLLSLENEGKLYYQGICSDFVEELALQLDEDFDNVQVTISFLEKVGLLEKDEEDEGQQLTQVAELTGSEADSARRVRKYRERKKLQSNGKTLQSNNGVTNSNTEIDKEIEIEIEIDDRDRFIKRFKELTNKSINQSSIKNIPVKSLDPLLKEIEQSEYLKNNLTIQFATKNLNTILSGKYRDFKKIAGSKETNFHNFKQLSDNYEKDYLEKLAKEKRKKIFESLS